MYEYKEYYIAYIDVLGFKQMINEKTCQDVVEIYRSIKAMRTLHEVFEENGVEKTVPLIPHEELNIKVMSDSVCIYIRADLPRSLFQLIFICIDFQSRMLESDPPILLRGAITKGNLYSDGDILFGPGFVKSYLMEENNASVPRIIITKQTIDDYNNNYPDSRLPDNILNRDYDAFYYVEYISAYGFTNREKVGKYDELYNYIEQVLNSTTDDSVKFYHYYLKMELWIIFRVRT